MYTRKLDIPTIRYTPVSNFQAKIGCDSESEVVVRTKFRRAISNTGVGGGWPIFVYNRQRAIGHLNAHDCALVIGTKSRWCWFCGGRRNIISIPTHRLTMDLQQAALAVFGVAVGYLWYKRYHTSPISDIPGPKNPSWIYGNLPFFPTR